MMKRTLDSSDFIDAKEHLGKGDIADCICILSQHTDHTDAQIQAITQVAINAAFENIKSLMEQA